MNSAPLERLLALAGAMPFWLCTLALLLGLDGVGWVGVAASQLLASYTLLIVSFMAGTLWQRHNTRTTALSNLIALLAWFSYWVLPLASFLLVAAVLFSWLLQIDGQRYRSGMLSHHYWQTRKAVTLLVCLALVVSAATL